MHKYDWREFSICIMYFLKASHSGLHSSESEFMNLFLSVSVSVCVCVLRVVIRHAVHVDSG